MLIPYQELSPEALQGLIEDFVSREGTDYGEQEFSLAEKANQVRGLLKAGKCCIWFDAETSSVAIVDQSNLPKEWSDPESDW